jgi:hemin uptake protein HemP
MMGTFQPVETRQPSAVVHPTYDAADLTKGGDRALILLNDQTYVLRITRAGKLILTK